MSQEAVERVLGRLITDERFRRAAADSFEAACRQEGYGMTTAELRLVSGLEIPCFAELAGRLDAGLCRAGATTK
jgi:hypothetical protein